MNGPHLSDIALVVLAASRRRHPHIEVCTYCREQYEALLAMEEFEDAEADAPMAGAPGAAFRLAAQSELETNASLVLRQTWYLDQGNVLLRVFEEHGKGLIAYVLCAPERLHRLRFFFSGLPGTFAADQEGRFAIGPASIAIEPMAVTFDEES